MKKVIVLAVVLAFAVSLCAEFDFYGSLRSGWWYENGNEDYWGGDEGRMTFQSSLYSSSRIGTKYMKDGFCAKVEMGISSSSVYLRQAYAEQDMGNFKLLAGKAYTGFADFADQVYGWGSDLQLKGYGMLYDGRKNMIKVTMNNGLYVALIEPVKMDPAGVGTYGVDAMLPKINIGAHLTYNGFDLHPTFGFATSTYNEDFSSYDEGITAYAAAITAKYNMNDISLKGQFGFGQNIGNYGFTVSSPYSYAAWNMSDNEVVNSMTTSFYVQAAYQAFKGGFGYSSSKIDDDDYMEDPDANSSFFVQYKMMLGQYLCLIPEIGVVNFMEDGFENEEGSITYFGAVLRADLPK